MTKLIMRISWQTFIKRIIQTKCIIYNCQKSKQLLLKMKPGCSQYHDIKLPNKDIDMSDVVVGSTKKL